MKFYFIFLFFFWKFNLNHFLLSLDCRIHFYSTPTTCWMERGYFQKKVLIILTVNAQFWWKSRICHKIGPIFKKNFNKITKTDSLKQNKKHRTNWFLLHQNTAQKQSHIEMFFFKIAQYSRWIEPKLWKEWMVWSWFRLKIKRVAFI